MKLFLFYVLIYFLFMWAFNGCDANSTQQNTKEPSVTYPVPEFPKDPVTFYMDQGLWEQALIADGYADHLDLPGFQFEFKNPEKVYDILIIGDSISIGYTTALRDLFPDANVMRIPGNARNSRYTLQNLDKWLVGQNWDLIIWNNGLWDARKNPVWNINLVEYEQNLNSIALKLKTENKRVVFITTTPLPPEHTERLPVEPYNVVAKGVMATNQIQVIDLYQLIIDNNIQTLADNNVHYNTEASEQLAELIEMELNCDN